MPVPADRLESGTIWVDVAAEDTSGRVVPYARESSHGECSDLDRQVARLTAWTTSNGHAVGEVVCEVGFGLNGKRPKLRRMSDPPASVVDVEHRDRPARFGVEHLEAALGAHGRHIVVADSGESTDDLVRDMRIEVLTSMCARLYGRRGAGNRAMRAVTAIKAQPGQMP